MVDSLAVTWYGSPMNPATDGYTTTGQQVEAHVLHPLPFTGFDVGPLLCGAVLLLSLGVWLRRLTT